MEDFDRTASVKYDDIDLELLKRVQNRSHFTIKGMSRRSGVSENVIRCMYKKGWGYPDRTGIHYENLEAICEVLELTVNDVLLYRRRDVSNSGLVVLR